VCSVLASNQPNVTRAIKTAWLDARPAMTLGERLFVVGLEVRRRLRELGAESPVCAVHHDTIDGVRAYLRAFAA
jgi:hypothetical protein